MSRKRNSCELNYPTKYDSLGRPIARTTWLTPRSTVDVSDPPIAGLGGIAASDGLTAQFLYDDNVSDGVGLESSTGVPPVIGSANVSLSPVTTGACLRRAMIIARVTS